MLLFIRRRFGQSLYFESGQMSFVGAGDPNFLTIFADEEHDEKAWAKHLPECLRFLSEKWY